MPEPVKLPAVLESWRRSAQHHQPAPPPPAARMAEAERRLGRPLPGDLRALYEHFDGGNFVGLALDLHPSVTDDPDQVLAVATAGDTLRSWDWPVPDELVVFADDGMGSSFGVWAPRGRQPARSIVVQLGEVFEPACLAVVATGLAGFLVAWTAYYLPLAGAPEEALAPLGVPAELLHQDDEDALGRLMHWASPDLPDPRPDPYGRGMTAEEVAAFVASLDV